jgi:hypothetical protein
LIICGETVMQNARKKITSIKRQPNTMINQDHELVIFRNGDGKDLSFMVRGKTLYINSKGIDGMVNVNVEKLTEFLVKNFSNSRGAL